MKSVKVGKVLVGGAVPAFVIAEIASAHEGSIDIMKGLVKSAADSGADAVKFQIFKAENLVFRTHPKFNAFGEIEFSEEQWKEILGYAKGLGLEIIVDVFDEWGIDVADSFASGYKVTSATLSEPGLVGKVACKQKPVFIGVGGSTLKETEKAIGVIRERGNDKILLLHGFQAFPTKVEDTNLNLIKELKNMFGLPVGFADHIDAETRLATVLPVVSLGFGASVIEKHITPDRSRKGRDYYSALNPDEFAGMVGLIREAEKARGCGVHGLSSSEMEYREKMKKYMVASKHLKKGEVIGEGSFVFRRATEPGLLPSDAQKIIGKRVKRSLKPGDPIKGADVGNVAVLIAVRMKSKRLPRKAMINIAGKPLIEHVIDSFRESKAADSIILCTSTNPDDSVLVEKARKCGIPWFAGSEDDVLGRFIRAAEENGVDVVVRASGEDPLTDIGTMDAMIEQHLKSGSDYTYTTQLPRGTAIEVITTKALKRARELADNPDKSEYMTLYFRDSGMFNAKEFNVTEDVKRPDYRLTVDTPDDLELIKTIFEKLYNGRPIRLADAVKVLDDNPGMLDINRNIKQRKCICKIVGRGKNKKVRIIVED
jgi:N,N'-diacetyllegionaminate synthase